MLRVLTLAAACLAGPAAAATITVGPNPMAGEAGPLSLESYAPYLDSFAVFRADCYHRLYSLTQAEVAVTVTGRIEEGDLAAFEQAAGAYAGTSGGEYACPRAVVLLDSPGGELAEAIELGRKIAEYGFATVVGPEAECLSACVLALAGGSYLSGAPANIVVYSGARVGLHQPQFNPTPRQRGLIGAIPEADRIDLAYTLAGAEWANITRYLIGERRNAYLTRRLLASPQEAEAFDHFDSFAEFYFAGMTVVGTEFSRLPADALPDEGPIATAMLDGEMARVICALPLIKQGSLADFRNSYATRVGGDFIVGIADAGLFCYARVEWGLLNSCTFTKEAFWAREAELPAWMAQWGVGAMGYYPVTMFLEPEEWGGTAQDMDEAGAFLAGGFAAGSLCRSDIASFPPHQLAAFPVGLRIGPDCPAPNGLCD